MIKVDELIKEALKEKDEVKLSVLRAIKNELLLEEKKEDAKPIDDTAEIHILKKLVKQREESISMFKLGKREDLASKEEAELKVLKKFLPAEVTQAEIEAVIEKWKKENSIENKIPKKSMGVVIKYVKSALPMADGKITAGIVNSMLE